MGDHDSTDFINLETGRIPFKHSSMDLADWDGTFRSWTGYTKGWKDWYYRVSQVYAGTWEKYGIGRCITLSLSEMPKNESLLIAASYFWSDALNAFLFGHGPFTLTLADVLMLTGLDVSASDTLFSLRLAKPSHKLKTKGVGGWLGYINKHAKTKGACHIS